MHMAPHILLVEDEAPVRELVAEYLRGRGASVQEAHGVEEARVLLVDGHWDVVITDLRFPDGDGTELIVAACAKEPPIAAVVLSGVTNVEAAVGALRAGALDYLVKPVRLREVFLLVERALALHAEREERKWAADALALLGRAELATAPEDAEGCVPHMLQLLARMRGAGRVEIVDAGEALPEGVARALGPHRALVLQPDLPPALPIVLAVSRALDRCAG